MTSLYLIRHAQAVGNVEKRFQGRTDLPLTQEGQKQSRQLAPRMQVLPLDAVYTSPLRRAFDTANAITSQKHSKPIICPGLIEIDGGAFENRLFDELRVEYPKEFYQFTEEPHAFAGVGGGESLAQVYARMKKYIHDLVRNHHNGCIAAVSHGAAIRCYLCYALGLPLEQLGAVGWVPNTGVSHITFDDKLYPSVRYMGDDSHLYTKVLAINSPYAQ